ncbi:MAG: hypothetical protein P4L68_03100 [Methylovirgula sp.]|jgi:hypothetical protein|nr:hypothetical protein [Methylovirgula sp.]
MGSAVSSHSVTEAELQQFADFIGVSAAAPGRCSLLLLFQLYCSARAPSFPADPAKVVAEIRGLEGLGGSVGTKSAEKFKYPPLGPFWKKHFLVGGAAPMVRNIQNALGKKQKVLRKIVEENWNPTTSHLPPEVISKNIADAVMDLYANRRLEEKLTGEWIIFGRNDEKNYYLTLATHDEPNEQIFERMERVCSREFPFLFGANSAQT